MPKTKIITSFSNTGKYAAVNSVINIKLLIKIE
jgi:hypothetical protein